MTDEHKDAIAVAVIGLGRAGWSIHVEALRDRNDFRIVDVADALGIGDGALGNWVRQARVDRGEREGLTTEEKAELARLRKENARLRMERDLLKRATAFWVKESGQ